MLLLLTQHIHYRKHTFSQQECVWQGKELWISNELTFLPFLPPQTNPKLYFKEVT